jgi:hypothetical protein
MIDESKVYKAQTGADNLLKVIQSLQYTERFQEGKRNLEQQLKEKKDLVYVTEMQVKNAERTVKELKKVIETAKAKILQSELILKK